jgi:3-oxoadipate enol-lactonase
MLHGIGSNSRAFRYQLADLSDSFDVVAWDAPGYGRSDDPAGPFTLEDLADAAAGLLDSLGLTRAHALGVSMGGVIAQLMALRHADRVRSLVLVDTNPGGGGLPEPERSARVRQRLEMLEGLGPRRMAEQRGPRLVRPGAPAALVAEVIEIMAEVRPAGYCAAAVALGSTDVSHGLSEIRVPTLVLHGAEDAVVPVAVAQHLAQTIPAARLEIIPVAGHLSNQEQPAVFNALVRDFLRTVVT